MKKQFIIISLIASVLAMLNCGDLDRTNPLDPHNPSSQRQETVLIESFVNESGGEFIVSSTDALERLLRDYGNDAFIYLEHHVEKTSGTDPWALDASLSRYLSLVPVAKEQALPDVLFNGNQARVQGASDVETVYQRYKPALEAELARQTRFTIECSAEINGNAIEVEATIARLGNSKANDIGAVIAVSESVPGYTVRRITRAWVPAKSIGDMESGELTSFDREIDIKPEWDRNRLQVVVIIQNSANFQVFQCKGITL